MELLKQNIERIEIKDEVLEILKENNITLLIDLCNKKKKELKKMGIENQVINDMELQGLSKMLCKSDFLPIDNN